MRTVLVPRLRRLSPVLWLGALLCTDPVGPSIGLAAQTPAPPEWRMLAEQAEITRTTRGIPHIEAENTTAAGFALGWVQMEDYGPRVIELLMAARGETARLGGPGDPEARVLADARARRTLRAAQAGFSTLSSDVQGIYTGFALAVNRWIELHPEDAHPAVRPDFEPYHVLARDVPGPDWALADRYLRSGRATGLSAQATLEQAEAWSPGLSAEPGSNTWALAPERTTSGGTILMRNPHLAWTAGYYEGHMQITGDLNFYGDFRIGGPFSVIGGWNDRLGWSTTNNAPQLSDLYWLTPHPEDEHKVSWNGAWVALQSFVDTVWVWEGSSIAPREMVSRESPVGPVVYQGEEGVLVVRTAGDGNPRLGEQFLAMMRAQSLDRWLDAMRMQSRTQSNFTYADADGNIFYVWNAMHPVRPHPHGADTLAHRVDRDEQVWRALLPFDALPQLLNPPGGYLRNENDSFHYTNLNAVLPAEDYPPEAEYPQLRLRSQHSLELLHNDVQFSLEDVVALRASERMLLADRVLDDLLRALRGVEGWSPLEEEAIDLLAAWDRTTATQARGAVLFTEWWARYLESAGRGDGSPANRAAAAGFQAPAEGLFARPWSADTPLETPSGLANPAVAVHAFGAAVQATEARWGSVGVAWGDVHRARHGRLDLPVSGCDGLLGCFRVMWFNEDADGRRRVRGGDGWLSAVEFLPEGPRGYTVLAYGQSSRPGSPHHEDQLQDFIEHRMTPVAWTEEAIEEAMIRRYRPGWP